MRFKITYCVHERDEADELVSDKQFDEKLLRDASGGGDDQLVANVEKIIRAWEDNHGCVDQGGDEEFYELDLPDGFQNEAEAEPGRKHAMELLAALDECVGAA